MNSPRRMRKGPHLNTTVLWLTLGGVIVLLVVGRFLQLLS
jgi:hypothetical protein